MINTDGVSCGEIFKNFGAMCKALDIIPKPAGKSRDYQILEIKRFINFEKVSTGHPLVVIEVYEEPIPKGENVRNTAEYIQYGEILLMQYLLTQPKNHLIISNSHLANKLNMVHNDFKEYYDSRVKLSSMLEVDLNTIDDFLDSANSSYRGSIKTILNRLTSKMAIIYYPVMSIIIKEYDEESDAFKDIYREATEKEKEEILEIRNKVLDRPEYYGNMKRVRASKKLLKYYEDVNKQLYEDLNIRRAYTSYSITINHQAIGREFSSELKEMKILNSEEVASLKVNIQKSFAERSMVRARNRHLNAIENNEQNHRVPYKYIEDNRILVEAFIMNGVNKTYHGRKN